MITRSTRFGPLAPRQLPLMSGVSPIDRVCAQGPLAGARDAAWRRLPRRLDVLRAGDIEQVLGHRPMAASTLGAFLRSFTFGHVRQLDRVLAETCGVRGRRAPAQATNGWSSTWIPSSAGRSVSAHSAGSNCGSPTPGSGSIATSAPPTPSTSRFLFWASPCTGVWRPPSAPAPRPGSRQQGDRHRFDIGTRASLWSVFRGRVRRRPRERRRPVAGSTSAGASEVSVRGLSASATASRNCHKAVRALRTFRAAARFSASGRHNAMSLRDARGCRGWSAVVANVVRNHVRARRRRGDDGAGDDG
jgi:hypothetical protein